MADIENAPKTPAFRKLRGYAFDPSLSIRTATAFINDIIYKVDWEAELGAGPTGEYLEVIDFDPTVKKFYSPVNLNNRYVLAQDGLDPSESNPQFHQQMVYAVAMTTIRNFEKALGRPILWCPRILDKKSGSDRKYEYVPRLRIYPHAFRDANAYYSPQKKALLFGYFSSSPADSTIQMPNSQVFTCLSHDIIAHETTHAILDGIYSRYINDTNPDTLAFHEAFADIVALFQHFTFPEVLKNQIAATRGDLASQNLLGQLAQQFGSAVGKYGALRDAIGYIDPRTNQWKAREPNGDEYQTVTEPHARGSILVSAIFEAFLTIYKNRVADLLRIATGGSGILPMGELHPDLVNRLAKEASKAAGHILNMCIRALDYCPPVDITYGDYLRAIITADVDLVPDDDRSYRLAFIDAFRRRGIYPPGIKSLSVESLCYPEIKLKKLDRFIYELTLFLRDFSSEIIYSGANRAFIGTRNPYEEYEKSESEQITEKSNSRQEIFRLTREYIEGRHNGNLADMNGIHQRLYEMGGVSEDFERITGLAFTKPWDKLGIRTSNDYSMQGPVFEVHSLKLASRVGPSGKKSNQIIISLTQNAGISIGIDENREEIPIPFVPGKGLLPSSTEFVMTGGVTLIFDLDSLKLKYAISKPLIDPGDPKSNRPRSINRERALQLYYYYSEDDLTRSAFDAYFGAGKQNFSNETFSFLHTH